MSAGGIGLYQCSEGEVWRRTPPEGGVALLFCAREGGVVSVAVRERMSLGRVGRYVYHAPWRVFDSVPIMLESCPGVFGAGVRFSVEKYLGFWGELLKWAGPYLLGIGMSLCFVEPIKIAIHSPFVGLSVIAPWVISGAIVLSIGLALMAVYRYKLHWLPSVSEEERAAMMAGSPTLVSNEGT